MLADEVLQQAVQGITDLINVPAVINLDFADVQTVMRGKGVAHIGIGHGKGDDKAMEAIKMAVESPLLETTIKGATDVIINVSGDISMYDADDAANYVQQIAGEDINIIFGAMYDDSQPDSCKITVIATGLEETSAGVRPGALGGFAKAPIGTIGASRVVSPKPVIQTPGAQREVVRPTSIQRPADIKSKVEENQLKIPEFLQKK